MNPTDALIRRLERLEQEQRRWRRAAVRSRAALLGVGLLAAGALVVGADVVPETQEIVQARRLEVVNAEGRLVFAVDAEEGGGRVNVWTEDGKNVVRLTSNDSGGDLNLWNRSGGTIFSAYATTQGGELGLWSATGDRTLRALTAEHGGRLEVGGPGGHPAVVAAAHGAGGALDVAGATGEVAVSARADANGAGMLNVHGAQQNPIFTVEANETLGTSLLLSGADGRPRVMMRTEDRGGALTFANGLGKPALTLGVAEPDGAGFVDVANADGTRIFAAGAEEDGCGRIDLSNADGQRVFAVDGVGGVGATLGLFDAGGGRSVMFGSRAQGGLLNIFNRHEVPVFVASYSEENLGGAMSLMNGRGSSVITAASDDLGHGRIVVYDVEGKRRRIVQTPR